MFFAPSARREEHVVAGDDHGLWRSQAAHSSGGRGVGGSNPPSPTRRSPGVSAQGRPAAASRSARMRVFDVGARDGPQAVSRRILTWPNLLSFARLAVLPVIYLDLVSGRWLRGGAGTVSRWPISTDQASPWSNGGTPVAIS